MYGNQELNRLDPISLAQWCGGKWENGCPETIAGVSTDSRSISRSNLFLALTGERFDGHDYVPAALLCGAAGAVVSAGYSAGDCRAPLLRVPDTLAALQAMAAGRRLELGIRIIAVTGSVGKTSVKEMIADVLSVRMPVARSPGNWNNHIGLPLSLLNMPADIGAGVMEIGINHPGEMDALCRILKPDWGVVTNVGPVHIEYFRAESDIADEKARLFHALPRNGISFLRIDSPWFGKLRGAAPGRVITIALEGGPDRIADFFCRPPPISPGRENSAPAEFWERGGTIHKIRPSLPGLHVITNMLFAVAVGRVWGVAWEDISATLECFTPQPMRWERRKWRDVEFINDAYNANPMSMKEALETFSRLESAGKWIVLGDMLELGNTAGEFHRALGRMAAAYSWQGIIAVGAWAEMVVAAAAAAGIPSERLFKCESPSEAAAVLERSTRAGDMVLLKGSRGVGLERIFDALPPGGEIS